MFINNGKETILLFIKMSPSLLLGVTLAAKYIIHIFIIKSIIHVPQRKKWQY